MKFIPTDIPEVLIIEPEIHGDSRGYFAETYRAELLDSHVGHHVEFVQDNESCSSAGVLRGLHYQRGEASQAKLVRVTTGEIVDVAVDLRQSSPTFLHHVAVRLSAANHRQLFVPRGFAHGFIVLSPTAVFQYKVDNRYCPESEVSLRYDDPALGIAWPTEGLTLNLSPKDLAARTLDRLRADGLLFN